MDTPTTTAPSGPTTASTATADAGGTALREPSRLVPVTNATGERIGPARERWALSGDV